WGWELDNQIQQAGSDSVPEDFFFNNPGSYTMSINNGGCTVTSEPLHYQTVSCEGCPTAKPELKSITTNNTPYCSYTVVIEILNFSGTPYQATISNTSNNAIITPASFTIDPNSTFYTFTIIPTGPIIGSTTDWLLQGNVPGGENGYNPCQISFGLTTYECEENNESSKTALTETELSQGVQHQVNLFPNPAKESVAVQYNLSTTAAITLYDLTGRALAEHATSNVSGEWNLTTGTYPAGIYLVVLKQTDGKVWQHKLVIE
ncbi:T9SS type A sorting domain-containing protein, partial [Flavobacterium sp. UBA6135]|uniref:T9SS type A sorting domain-containing protein n=1 Tax=Flavobacterium sp. UBA6135 TaxID=1946553 RepID=UPI0025C1DAB0